MSTKQAILTRRRLLCETAGGAAAITMASLASTAPAVAASRKWDVEADIVCVGSGAAGLTAAAVAASRGNRVVVLEKAPITGGTTRKSGGVFWIPNHFALREKGIVDRKEDCMKYICRMAYPEQYRPEGPSLGLDPAAYALLEAYYDNGYRMVDLLRELGVLRIAPFNMWHMKRPEPDYQDHLPENKVPQGRALAVRRADWTDGDGAEYIDQYVAFLTKQRVEILTDHAVERLIQNAKGEVCGVEARTEDGTVTIRGKRATIFGTGGYAHNLDYVRRHQRCFLYGSCAVPSATGDFITIAGAAGARMGDLGTAWRSQALLEEAVVNRRLAHCVDMPPGDSMFVVNKHGRRVVNEKCNYNDRAKVHLAFDPNHGEFPNQLLFMIYDIRTAELFAGSHPLPAEPSAAPHVIVGNNLPDLARQIEARMENLREYIGTLRLADDFVTNLQQTFVTFNAYAKNGADPEFYRGSTEYDRAYALYFQPPRSGTRWPVATGLPNPAMCPLQSEGPYFAMILSAGALDTSGGPEIDRQARVLDVHGEPIPGLYGAGNCIASPSREAYYGAGGTIGPAMTFAYIAAMHAAIEPTKEI